mgnify:FL=1
MNKTVKKSLIIIAIVIVLFAIIWLVYDMLKKDTVDTSSDTNIVDGNTGLDNIINDLFENDMIENEIENEVTENVTSNSSKENDNTKNEPDTTEKTTSKEEKAIELAKKKWGSTSGVYFSNEGINSDGRYIVSVRDGKSTSSLAFYLVDVEKGLVTDF